MNISMIVKNLMKLNETSLPEKENFCSHLKMEDITDADYNSQKKFVKIFK